MRKFCTCRISGEHPLFVVDRDKVPAGTRIAWGRELGVKASMTRPHGPSPDPDCPTCIVPTSPCPIHTTHTQETP